MVAHHVAQPRVPGFDEVVRGRDRPVPGELVIEEGEQVVFPDTLADHASGFDEPLVRVLDTAIRILAVLVKKLAEVLFPLVVSHQPVSSGFLGCDTTQRDGQLP